MVTSVESEEMIDSVLAVFEDFRESLTDENGLFDYFSKEGFLITGLVKKNEASLFMEAGDVFYYINRQNKYRKSYSWCINRSKKWVAKRTQYTVEGIEAIKKELRKMLEAIEKVKALEEFYTKELNEIKLKLKD